MRVYHTCRQCVICKQYYLARLNFEKAKRHEQLLVGFKVLSNSRGCCVQEKTAVEEGEGIASHSTTDDREKVEGQKEIANNICSINCEFSFFFLCCCLTKCCNTCRIQLNIFLRSLDTQQLASYLSQYPLNHNQLASQPGQLGQLVKYLDVKTF